MLCRLQIAVGRLQKIIFFFSRKELIQEFGEVVNERNFLLLQEMIDALTGR